MTAQLELVSRKKTYTVDEFMAMTDRGKRYELVEGELVEMSGPSFQHGKIILKIGAKLQYFLEKNLVGEAASGSTFELNPKNGPVPDVAFVRTENIPADIDPTKAFPGAPDLAIEVMSPSDKWSQVIAKVHRYQAAGVKIIWVIDPFDQNVFVYYQNNRKKVLGLDDELDGEDLLPGFKLAIKDLFE